MRPRKLSLLAALILLPSGFYAGQALATSPSPAPETQEPASQVASAVEQPAEILDEPQPLTEAVMADLVKRAKATNTPLSDCPEALDFFQQPEIREFYLRNFGYEHDAGSLFAGGCPDLQTAKKMYAAAQQEVQGR